MTAVVVAGWWYWRNYTLYGEWLGTRTLLTINGMRTTAQTWRSFLGEMRGLRYSFWGLFGLFSILLPAWLYRLLDTLTVVSLAGLATAFIRSWRHRRGRLLDTPATRVRALLALWAVLLIGLMFYWATFATSSQGRLLFPAVGAFGVLFVAGLAFWLQWLPSALRVRALGLLPLGLLACSLYALIVLFPRSYGVPPSVATVPTGAHPAQLLYNGKIELLAVTVPDKRHARGEPVPVTLYFRAREKVADDWPLFVQVLDQKKAVLGNVTTHPGSGRNPTSLWQPGTIYRDEYLVTLDGNPGERSPLLASIYVGFMDARTKQPLASLTEDGTPSDGIVDVVQVGPTKALDVQSQHLTPFDASFGDAIQLIGDSYPDQVAQASPDLPVRLLWQAGRSPNGDYTVFVHLMDEDGRLVAGFDQPPAEGRFPTRYWQLGDRSLSDFPLALPPGLVPGRYELWTGVYLSASQGAERLPVAAEHPMRDQSVLLGTVEVR